jgi:DNA-binding XRE family transcriptional regulator
MKIEMIQTLQRFRITKNISLKDAALFAGIPINSLIKFEQDSRQMPCSIAVKLCRLYGLQSVELIYIGREEDCVCKPSVKKNLIKP